MKIQGARDVSEEVIKTARRLFEVLEHFDAVQRPLSLKEIADRFGYPVSSASALLKSVVALGYLDYDRYSRTYMPTMRIVQLGAWVQGALFGEGSITSLVRHLSEATQETVNIATQSDLHMQYIHVVPSAHTIQFNVRPGTLRPLAQSGLGMMLLSARTDDVIERLVRRINIEANDPSRKVNFQDLMRRIRDLRVKGYVVSLNTVTPGAGIIGALLPQRRHGRILAIGVGGPADRLADNQEHILRVLRDGIARYLPAEGQE